MKKKITYYLYLDRKETMRVRKQKYQLTDGELCVKVVLNVPHSFFKAQEVYKEISVQIPERKQVSIEVSADSNA